MNFFIDTLFTNILAILDFWLLVIVVGLTDYFLFYKASSCPGCGKKPHPLAWVPATALELGLFLIGVILGLTWGFN